MRSTTPARRATIRWVTSDLSQYDTRDEQEHAEITALLASLSEDHPARVAYADGADTITMTHLVADRPELVDGLKKAYLAGYGRVLARSGGIRP